MSAPSTTRAIEVRWRDVDALGHVNHAVYFTYFEDARMRYLHELGQGIAPEERPPGFILASARCDYERPVELGDTVEIRLRTLWFGRTSFSLGYEAFSRKQGAVAARGETVLLTYDYAAKKAVPLPAAWREAVARAEGREIPAKPK